MQQYLTQLENLYAGGARNFLIVNIPPVQRTPMWVTQSPSTVATVALAALDFNSQLAGIVKSFVATYNTTAMISQNGALGQVKIMDAYSLFNFLLDNAGLFGYYDITGYCPQYVYGTASRNTQLPGCAPTSAYFWLNTLHPLWTVHEYVIARLRSKRIIH